jgi:hypothetical protein
VKVSAALLQGVQAVTAGRHKKTRFAYWKMTLMNADGLGILEKVAIVTVIKLEDVGNRVNRRISKSLDLATIH